MWVAVSEDLAARRLAGFPGDPDELFRAEGVARRAVKAVLATKVDPTPQERPGLRIARARWAENAARAAATKKDDSNA